MPLIGITGGIGTGKSAVARFLQEFGAVTFSADDAAREVTKPHSQVVKEIAAAFGSDHVLPDGELNREKLAATVFSDSTARERLEAITHPRILRTLKSQIAVARAANPSDAVIAVEAPLLFEAGMENWFDQILVVTASEEKQIQRLGKRSGLDAEESLRRIRAQMPLSAKAARAHAVIRNDGSLDDLKREAHKYWESLLKPAILARGNFSARKTV